MLTQNVTRNVAQRRKNAVEISSFHGFLSCILQENFLSFALSKFGQHIAERVAIRESYG
jgi:hypothetical protein